MPASPPATATSLLSEAVKLHQAGRLADAEKIYRQILAAEPDHFDSLHLLGVIFFQRGNPAVAVQLIDAALARNPESSVALNNRGNALQRLNRLEDSLASYDRALALQPDYAEAHSNRGAALHALRRFEEAVRSFDRAIALRPNYPEALSNRGNAQKELLRFEDALASHDRALAQQPDHAGAHCNRGNVLHQMNRFDEALASYERALAIQPNYPKALSNLGLALQEAGRFEAALASYDRALAIRPDFAEARYCEALCRLLIGDFARGWQNHEWRWGTDQLRSDRRNFSQPLWLGGDEIAGKTILLHAEQGLGDTIQFCRYVPLVELCGARVVLEVQKPLATLMQSLPGAAQVVARRDPLPDFDLHCPLLSLPLAFRTRLETIPSQIRYLAAPEDKIRAWRARLGAQNPGERDKARVGLVWAGHPGKEMPNAGRIDRQRSVAFDRLAPIFKVTNCDFYSLQKGDAAVRQLRDSALRDHVTDWTDELHDFSDTAALVENLDLVIAVDTSVAHLAGALGKPFWLLNRSNSCWRWLRDRDDSPWYPTARLFRQDESGAWDGVIARIAAALAKFSC
jgi:tetratricopeptide (TPR) repeat protein